MAKSKLGNVLHSVSAAELIRRSRANDTVIVAYRTDALARDLRAVALSHEMRNGVDVYRGPWREGHWHVNLI